MVTDVTLKIYHDSSMLGMTFGIPLSGDAVSSCGILLLVLKQGPAPDCWTLARVVKVESEADLDDRATVDAPGWSRLAVAGRACGPARLAVAVYRRCMVFSRRCGRAEGLPTPEGGAGAKRGRRSGAQPERGGAAPRRVGGPQAGSTSCPGHTRERAGRE